MRQERSSLVNSSPGLVIESETSIDPASSKTLNKNVEESKRDVSLEELLNDNSEKRKKRINEDEKSVGKDTRITKSPRTHKKSLHSTPGEYIVLMVSTGEVTVFYIIIPQEGVGYVLAITSQIQQQQARVLLETLPKYRKLK